MSPILAEVFGTAILIVLGDGVVANVVLQRTKGHNSGWIVITAGWALGVTIAVYCVNRISGAHLNPAVTIALATTGAFDWAKVPMYIVAQIAGGFLGAVIVWLAYLPHWKATPDPVAKLALLRRSAKLDETQLDDRGRLGHRLLGRGLRDPLRRRYGWRRGPAAQPGCQQARSGQDQHGHDDQEVRVPLHEEILSDIAGTARQPPRIV